MKQWFPEVYATRSMRASTQIAVQRFSRARGVLDAVHDSPRHVLWTEGEVSDDVKRRVVHPPWSAALRARLMLSAFFMARKAQSIEIFCSGRPRPAPTADTSRET